MTERELMELDERCNRLWRRFDELKAAGKDGERHGEYEAVLHELRQLCAARIGAIPHDYGE